MKEHGKHRKAPEALATTALLLGLLSSAAGLPSGAAMAQGSSRVFAETGKTVQGRFLEYWNSNGGLAQQGFPISEQMQEKNDSDGKTYTVQYFERAVFELHPENKAPYDVLLSLLGNSLYKQKYPQGAPGQSTNKEANARAFSETGKTVGGIFLSYWNSHGGLAQQGFPISEEFQEKSDLDGKLYKVQYFERAVFEYHPENQAPNNVLLSQLGTFRYKAKQSAGGGPGQSSPTPTAPASGGEQAPGSIEEISQMSTTRGCHTSTLLPDGKVLITGGQKRDNTVQDSAEIFDPATRKFSPAGQMSMARVCHSAVTLPNGKILIVGGTGLTTAELYDPATGTFAQTGNLNHGRDELITATLLKNGKVLVTGGLDSNGKMMSSAELYDPATGTFSETGSMNETRTNHSATLLPDGRVLILAGGIADFGNEPNIVRSTAELYDPATGKFTMTGGLATARYKHGAVLLPNGKVLIVGGSDTRQLGGLITGAEMYDPATGRFSPAGNLNFGRYKVENTVFLLPSGKVLVAGGSDKTELYDPATKIFSTVPGSVTHAHFFQGGTLLKDGSVLLTGGYSTSFASYNDAYIYHP